MPMLAQPRLTLPTLTVASAASKAGLPTCRMSACGHRVAVQVERGHEHLPGDDVLDQLVAIVTGVDEEEDVLAGMLGVVVGEAPVDTQPPGGVAVADVPLAAGGGEPAAGVAGQDHVRGVDVGAVLALGETEAEDVAVLEQSGDLLAGGVVAAEPHRAQAEHRHLPGVPVRQGVEAQHLVEFVDAGQIPAGVGGAGERADLGRGGEGGENPLLGDQVEEVGVPLPGVVLLFITGQALGFEEVDQRQQLGAGGLVE